MNEWIDACIHTYIRPAYVHTCMQIHAIMETIIQQLKLTATQTIWMSKQPVEAIHLRTKRKQFPYYLVPTRFSICLWTTVAMIIIVVTVCAVTAAADPSFIANRSWCLSMVNTDGLRSVEWPRAAVANVTRLWTMVSSWLVNSLISVRGLTLNYDLLVKCRLICCYCCWEKWLAGGSAIWLESIHELYLRFGSHDLRICRELCPRWETEGGPA